MAGGGGGRQTLGAGGIRRGPAQNNVDARIRSQGAMVDRPNLEGREMVFERTALSGCKQRDFCTAN